MATLFFFPTIKDFESLAFFQRQTIAKKKKKKNLEKLYFSLLLKNHPYKPSVYSVSNFYTSHGAQPQDLNVGVSHDLFANPHAWQ